MFRSARTRLTLLLVTILLVLYTVTAGTIYVLMYRLTITDENELLMSSATPLAPRILTALNRGQFPREFVDLRALEQLFPRLSNIVLRDAMGQVLADTNAPVSRELPYTQNRLQTLYLPASKIWVRLYTVHFSNQYDQTEGGLQLALNITHDVASLRRLRTIVLEVGLIGGMAAVLGGFFASNRALQPIARSWNSQQRFVADASHELRTPLAVIQANLDVVLGHASESVLDNMEWLSNARTEIARLGRLTDDLLTLARIDSNQTQLRMEEVDLRAVVREICDSFAILAHMKDMQLMLDEPSARHPAETPMILYGDAGRLRQLVIILVDNAIKYTPNGGSVRILLDRRRDTIRLKVLDTGVGIGKEELRYIFDRFYRSDQARERATGGAGLGLAIARWIVTMHKGKLSASSKPGQGSVFTVLLPVTTPRH